MQRTAQSRVAMAGQVGLRGEEEWGGSEGECGGWGGET